MALLCVGGGDLLGGSRSPRRARGGPRGHPERPGPGPRSFFAGPNDLRPPIGLNRAPIGPRQWSSILHAHLVVMSAAVLQKSQRKSVLRTPAGPVDMRKAMNATSGFLGRFIKRLFLPWFGRRGGFATFFQRCASPDMFCSVSQYLCNVLEFDQRSPVVPCHGKS